MSTEESRYYLNGIYFHTKTETRPFYALWPPWYRLALAEVDQPKGANGMPDVIIPRKTIAEICKLLEEEEGDANLLSHTQITFNLVARWWPLA